MVTSVLDNSNGKERALKMSLAVVISSQNGTVNNGYIQGVANK